MNGHEFRATLEPDGQLSHWLKVSNELREASGAVVGAPSHWTSRLSPKSRN